MYNVTLISTFHGDLGECNADELHKIIDSISPDVIFEELPQDLFDRFYNKNDIPIESTEIKSVKLYLQTHNIKHIPVDIAPDSELSRKEIDYMFDTVKKYNVYQQAEDDQKQMIASDGFSFLNSKKCEELFEKKMMLEKYLIESMLNKNQLLRIHKLFYEEQDTRENAMLKNIYDYSKEHKYDKAIFMLGAGHRKSIRQKIQEYELKENFKLNWTFYSDLVSNKMS